MHLPTLLMQIAVIVIVARIIGLLFRKIHQPQVVGEMFAGILLGPSLLGWVAPGVSASLFPPESLGLLNALSQIGILLFMFLVGLELNPRLLKERRYVALLISHVSIVVPFFLGALLALYLYPRVSNDGVTFSNFALFLGTAMSITAFPVLARILTEHNMLRTQIGAIAIACAAIGDLTAWCILAAVVLLVRASAVSIPLWLTLAGSVTYALVMLLIARSALQRLVRVYREQGGLGQGMLALILLLALGSAWVTEQLGVHALFGAFLMGAIMPKDSDFVRSLSEKLEDFTVVLLLPLFFAYTGLRTDFGLFSSAQMWIYCGIIIGVAILGKFGGATIAARACGMTWRESSTIGILMNTRGLMELVVLNIGIAIGIISPPMFAMLVVMAFVTTVMTTPLLDWIFPMRLRAAEGVGTLRNHAAASLTTAG